MEMDEKEKKKNHPGIKNLKPIKPGEVRNPLGNNSVSQEVRDLRRYTNKEIELTIHSMLRMKMPELRTTLEDEGKTALQKLVGSILWKAIAGADTGRATWILERAGNRLPAVVQPVAMQIQNIGSMTNEELYALGQQALDVLRENIASDKTIDILQEGSRDP